jgi:ribose-phosphate pyrophosphokinase
MGRPIGRLHAEPILRLEELHRTRVVVLTILPGTAHPELAAGVARELATPLGKCHVERFPDGELSVRLEETVRGRDVFVVQPTSPPVNEHLFELLAFADACRRDSAARIAALMPYFGYARSDRRNRRREPITASMVAALLQCAGIERVLTIDLHTPQVEGFFHIPVDSLSAVPALCDAVRDRVPLDDMVVVSPDAGRVGMATDYADRLGRPLVVLHKRRLSGTETEVTDRVGDVRGCTCLIVDDIIATGSTLVASATALRDAGARPELFVAATHGLLLGNATDDLLRAGVRQLFVTDSVPPSRPLNPAVHIISIAPLLASAIRRELGGNSFQELYERAQRSRISRRGRASSADVPAEPA